MDGTPFENMEWHQKSRFKTADDQKSYEADYSERAKQHRDEELDYVNESQNSILFESVQYGVLIAGFRHSYQKDGKVGLTGRKIKDTAMAGYCGQLYATELVAWWQEPRVEMIIKAFREIETTQIHPDMVDSSFRRPVKPASIWRALNHTPHIDLLKKQNVELDVDDLTAANDQAGMVALIKKLPAELSDKVRAVDDNESLDAVGKEMGKKPIGYVARAIQLARFQQALVHTSNGKRFFPGKADIFGNPGRRVFEDFIEIEDLSRTLELFCIQKNRYVKTTNRSSKQLAQKPYYYPNTITATEGAVGLPARIGDGSPSHRRGETGPLPDDQTLRSWITTATTPTLPRFLDPEEDSASRAESVEPDIPVDGEEHADVDSDEEFGEDWRKLASDKTQLDARKTEAVRKQKDNNFDLWFAEEKQSFAQDRLRALEQELKDGEDDLQRLERERQDSVAELKKVEKEAKMLSVDITLAKNKRKRAELERGERQAKKQKQALETEADEE